MIRLTLSLAIWLSVTSVVPASLAPRKEASPASRAKAAIVDVRRTLASELPAKAARVRPSVTEEPEFLMTANTAVLLDGKPCQYEEVPAGAAIHRMEVAPDRKTVIRVFFRTRK
jgi:hypothetical protein